MNSATCPYRGLAPYREEDQPYFFGRTREREIIISNLYAAPLTIFYGASGVGKSSVILAGVVPQLADKSDLAVIVFRDWQLPDFGVRLKNAIWAAASRHNPEIPPVDENLPLDVYLARVLEGFEGTVFLILDQFEEYFVYDTADFDAELARAINSRDLEANFLLSLREDGLSRLDRLRHRIPNLLTNLLRLDHLTPDAARQAILRPICVYNRNAKTAGHSRVFPEKALVAAILDEVRTGRVSIGDARAPQSAVPNAKTASGRIETPFLQIVLVRLWEAEKENESSALRLTTFRDQLGGAERIVGSHLDQCLTGLTERQREVATRALRYLVTPSRTKIALSAADLAQFVESPRDEVDEVCKKLADPDSRVLSPVADSRPGAETRYELYHDTLAPAVLDWVRRAEAAEVDRKRQIADEQQRQRESYQQLRRWLMVVGFACIAALVASAVAFSERGRARKAAMRETEARRAAEQQLAIAEANQLAAASAEALRNDPELALLLALEAERVGPTNLLVPESNNALRRAMGAMNLRRRVELPGGVNISAATFSPDSRWLVAGDENGLVGLWDLHSPDHQPAKTWQGARGAVEFLEFTGSAGRILSLGEAGAIALWNQNGEAVRRVPPPRPNGDSLTMAAAPNGLWAAVSRSDQSLEFWDLERPSAPIQKPLAGPRDPVLRLEFSPDNQWLLGATDEAENSIYLWRTDEIVRNTAAAAAAFRKLEVTNGILSRVRFSPDSKRVVAAAGSQLVLWSLATNTPPVHVETGAPVLDARITANGSRCFTAGQDYRAIIWQKVASTPGNSTWTRAQELRHLGAVIALDVSSDDALLATASTDQSVRVWEVGTGNLVAELRGHTRPVSSVLFSRDNHWLLSWAEGEPPRIWKWSGGYVEESSRIAAFSGSLTAMALSEKGGWLAAGDENGQIQVFRRAAGTNALTQVGIQVVNYNPVRQLFFTRDETFLLGRSGQALPLTWQLEPFRAAAIQPSLGKSVGWRGSTDMDLEPGGRRLAIAFREGAIGIYDPANDDLLRTHRLVNPDDNSDISAVRWIAPDWIIAATTTTTNSRAPLSDREQDRAGRANLAIQASYLPAENARAGMGRRPLSIPRNSTLQIWNWRENKLLSGPSTDRILQLQVSPDGESLVTTHDADDNLQVWHLGSNRSAFSSDLRPVSTVGGGTSQVSVVRFSPDSQWLAAGYSDGQLLLQPKWKDGSKEPGLNRGLLANVIAALDFSADSKRLLVAGGNVIKVVSIPDLNDVATLPSPGGIVTSVRFTPKQGEILVGTSSGALVLMTYLAAEDGPELRALARRRVTRELTSAERAAFVPASAQ